MKEASVPNYTTVPCRGDKGGCMSNPGQDCVGFGGTSHRVRRQLWAAMAEAQSRGEHVIHWYGYRIQITTRLR